MFWNVARHHRGAGPRTVRRTSFSFVWCGFDWMPLTFPKTLRKSRQFFFFVFFDWRNPSLQVITESSAAFNNDFASNKFISFLCKNCETMYIEISNLYRKTTRKTNSNELKWFHFLFETQSITNLICFLDTKIICVSAFKTSAQDLNCVMRNGHIAVGYFSKIRAWTPLYIPLITLAPS